MRGPLLFAIPIAVVTWLVACLPGVSLAEQGMVTLTSRYEMSGKAVTLSYLKDFPEGRDPAAIFIVLSEGNGLVKLRQAQNGTVTHVLKDHFFLRSVPYLAESAIGLAVMDVPSDRSSGISNDFRKTSEHRQDMKAVIQDLRKRHGASKLYLAGTGAGCISALYAAKDQDREVGGLILAGADMNRLDEFDFSGLKVPVLVIHHVEDGCDSAPAIEAGELARKHRFAFVPVAGGDPDNGRNLCNMLTRHGFRGSEKGVSGAMAEWVSGKVPEPLAPAEAPFFLNEQVYWIPAGDVKLQTTVYRPEGKGLFPLVVMNHGVPPDKVKMQLEKFRHRYGSQAREFVKRGFVVAIPMRRGFGKSGGSYNDNFNNSYAFGLKDAADIRAVVEFMKNQPYVDGKRLVMLGQSGGGLASLAYGSEGDPSLLGIINFAGGIKSTGRGPWEHLLVETFGSYAKTTKVPSVWFYTENDSYFPPGLARSLHESYVRNNGRAKFLQLPPFKKDGHTLFYDSDGIPLWTAEIDAFLAGIGLQGKQ